MIYVCQMRRSMQVNFDTFTLQNCAPACARGVCVSAVLVEKRLNCVASGSIKQSSVRLFWVHKHVERSEWTTLQHFDWWIIHFWIRLKFTLPANNKQLESKRNKQKHKSNFWAQSVFLANSSDWIRSLASFGRIKALIFGLRLPVKSDFCRWWQTNRLFSHSDDRFDISIVNETWIQKYHRSIRKSRAHISESERKVFVICVEILWAIHAQHFSIYIWFWHFAHSYCCLRWYVPTQLYGC